MLLIVSIFTASSRVIHSNSRPVHQPLFSVVQGRMCLQSGKSWMKRPSSTNNNLGLWLGLFGQSKQPSKNLQCHLRMFFLCVFLLIVPVNPYPPLYNMYIGSANKCILSGNKCQKAILFLLISNKGYNKVYCRMWRVIHVNVMWTFPACLQQRGLHLQRADLARWVQHLYLWQTWSPAQSGKPPAKTAGLRPRRSSPGPVPPQDQHSESNPFPWGKNRWPHERSKNRRTCGHNRFIWKVLSDHWQPQLP